MKKNYINPEVTTFEVVQQNVIAVSFHVDEAETVSDVTLDVKEIEWDEWD